jgi:hypothetical protein
MAQSLEVQIKATSDVPAVVDKAKQATTSFEKQIEGIGTKFKGAFKDIFLSFLGPMALIGTTMAFISSLIDKNIQKSKDAIAMAEEGQSTLISSGQTDLARQNAQDEADAKARENAANVSQANAAKAQDLGKGDAILAKMWETGNKWQAASIVLGLNRASTNEAFQKTAAQMATESQKGSGAGSGKDFVTPTGFSNVIGVGANPVLEAMTRQLEEQQLQTALLQQIADNGQPPSADFTKDSNAKFYGGF